MSEASEFAKRMAFQLSKLENTWTGMSGQVHRQSRLAHELLSRSGQGEESEEQAALKQQLSQLLSQLESTAHRIESTLPKATRSLRRVVQLEQLVMRQSVLAQRSRLLQMHPLMTTVQDSLAAARIIWEQAAGIPDEGERTFPLHAHERFFLEVIRRELLEPGRCRGILLAGCPNPYYGPMLWQQARVVLHDLDPYICRWAEAIGSRYALESSAGALSVHEKSARRHGIASARPHAFDLLWISEETWTEWTQDRPEDLESTLGQIGAKFRFIAIDFDRSGAPEDVIQRLLTGVGYRIRRFDAPPSGERCLLLGENSTIAARKSFHLLTDSVLYDEEPLSVIDQLSQASPREMEARLPMACIPPGECTHADLRIRLSCSRDHAILNFISRSGATRSAIGAAMNSIGLHHSLEGVSKRLPPLDGDLSEESADLVFRIDPAPARRLAALAPEEIDWLRLYHEVTGFLQELDQRHFVPNRFRPGWCIWCPDGLRVCSPQPVVREESEDTLSAIWWFFQDLATGGLLWRNWPIREPEGELSEKIPCQVREKLTRLTEARDLREVFTEQLL